MYSRGGGEGATYFNCFSAANVLKGRYNEFNTFHVENGLQTLGDSKTTNTFNSEFDDAGVLLFARRDSNRLVTMADTWGPISFFKVERDGELMVDMIPVRVGNIGYMYDRVSGQLFGNTGQGEFVLGPDIIDYTAKDYVQDGLVGFYDSIENLGPGKSDDSGNVVEWISGNVNTGMRGDIFSNKTPAVLEACKTKYKTIEICVKDAYFSRDTGTKYLLYGATLTQFSFQVRKNAGAKPFVYTFLDTVQPGSDPLADANFCGTFTLCRNGDEVRYYRDFDITQKIKSTTNDLFEITNMKIPVSDAALSFTPCRVSVYNRALTAEEIAHNYEIDKARFGL